eukprot:SM009215S24369  [mRNA]  locus=s9215:3:406:- [translate_table: standard]
MWGRDVGAASATAAAAASGIDANAREEALTPWLAQLRLERVRHLQRLLAAEDLSIQLRTSHPPPSALISPS